MKPVKSFLTITLAFVLALASTFNILAVDLSEEMTANEFVSAETLEETTAFEIATTPEITGNAEETTAIEVETSLAVTENSEETSVSEITTVPATTESIEETSVPDITETGNLQISEKVYGIKFSTEKVFLLPNDSIRLEVELLTSPPKAPLHSEFIEEESTEVLVGESDAVEETVSISGETPENNLNAVLGSELVLKDIQEEMADGLIWSSSDESVAVIGYNGEVLACELGTAIVTASTVDGLFCASCEINVVEEIPEEKGEAVVPLGIAYTITFSPNTSWATKPTHWYIEKSSDYSVNFDVYKSDSKGNYIGDEGDISSLVNWQSSDTSVATVDVYGRVTGHKNGSATITASAKNGDTIYIYNPIHITVYTPYSSTRDGLAETWVNQYRSTVADCHTDRLAGMIYPGTELELYGTSGDYILASIAGKTEKYFLWSDGVYDRSKGKITIRKSGTSDTRRHRDVYTTQTLELSLTSGVIATWTTSDPSIVKINNSDSATRAKITLNPVAEGSVYITARFLGRVDVIHVTTITKYPESKMGITKAWCGKYRCSHLKCTMTDRKEGDTAPDKLVTVYGESGDFYYANVAGESSYIYMWKDGIQLQTWEKQCELENITSDRVYAPQSIALYGDYCYSFEIYKTTDSEGKIKEEHRLFRYNINTGDLDEMIPDESVGELYHASDAEIVEITENGENVPYIFVAGYNLNYKENSNNPNEKNYIVKLRFDNETKSYWEVARYTVNIAFTTITCISNGSKVSPTFLIRNGYDFYYITVPSNASQEQTLTANYRYTIANNEKTGISLQGTHYDKTSDILYVAFSSGYDSYIIAYTDIINARGEIDESFYFEIKSEGGKYFEVEGIGFRPNSTDNRLWFSAFEGSICNSGIYVDERQIKQ